MSEDEFILELNRVFARLIGVVTAIVVFYALSRTLFTTKEYDYTYDMYDFSKELIRLALSPSVE